MADCCTINVSLKVGIKGTSCPYVKALSWTLFLAFAAWTVSLGGLASLQDDCSGDPSRLAVVNGFSGISTCRTVYRCAGATVTARVPHRMRISPICMRTRPAGAAALLLL